MKYNKPPTTMKSMHTVNSSILTIKKILLFLSHNDNEQHINNNFECKETVGYNSEGLSTLDLTKEIISYPKELFTVTGSNYSDENRTLLNCSSREYVPKEYFPLSLAAIDVKSAVQQHNTDKICSPYVRTKPIFQFKPHMWSKKLSQGLVKNHFNKSNAKTHQASREEQELCSAINLNVLKVATNNCDTRRDNMPRSRKGQLNRQKLYNPDDLSYVQTLLESDVNVEGSSENVIATSPASKMLKYSPSSSPEQPAVIQTVVTAVIEPLPEEKNNNKKPNQKAKKNRKVVTKKKSKKKTTPTDFDAIEIIKSPCVSNQNNRFSKRIAGKCYSRNCYPDMVMRQVADDGNDSLFSDDELVTVKKKTKRKKSTLTTAVTKESKLRHVRTPLNFKPIFESQENELEKNRKVVTKKRAPKKVTTIDFDATEVIKSSDNRACVSNVKNRFSKRIVGKSDSKNSYLDMVMREGAYDRNDSLHSDDELLTVRKKTKREIGTSTTVNKKNVRIKHASFKPIFEPQEKPQSSSSSLLPELEIELKTPPRPVVIERLSDSDEDIFPEPVSPTIKVLSNISSTKQLENKNICGECVPTSVSHNSAIEMPANQVDDQDIHSDHDFEGFDRSYDFVEMDVHDLTILEPNDIAVTNKNVDEAYKYLLSPQTIPPSVEHSNELIKSWISTGLPNDQTQALKSVVEAVLSGYAHMIEASLQSLRGPLPPSLNNLYDTLVALDKDVGGYLKKKK